MSTLPADLGGRLRYLRESSGLSAEHVAIEIERSARVIGDWERNYRSPRLFLLRQLAALYGVNPRVLTEAATISEESR